MKKQLSGKFVLRIPPNLHLALHEVARSLGVSLNDICVQRLAGNFGVSGETETFALLLSQAIAIHGKNLEGIVLYGSAARGELTQGSDIDVLIVLKSGVQIQRALYRKWEEPQMTLGERLIEITMVALPTPNTRTSGFWAEIALDGVIIWDKEGHILRHLVRVRRQIADGLIRQEKSHGQAYWINVNEVQIA